MRKRCRPSTRQGMLFSPVVDEQVLSPKDKSRAVSALAELLLEAAGLPPRRKEGGEDEPEDHD